MQLVLMESLRLKMSVLATNYWNLGPNQPFARPWALGGARPPSPEVEPSPTDQPPYIEALLEHIFYRH